MLYMMDLMAKGILENSFKPIAAVRDLTKSIADVLAETQTLALDTSELQSYDAQDLTQSVFADIDLSTDDSGMSFQEAMEAFYREYVQPTMNQMAEDMRRQADKEEHPVVQIGNRTITDAVETQRRANGFRFAT